MPGRALAATPTFGLTILPSPLDTTTSDASRKAVASRLAELAQAHGMNVSPSADLATLLKAIEVSDPIPIAAFGVVAEILFAILNANQHQQNQGDIAP